MFRPRTILAALALITLIVGPRVAHLDTWRAPDEDRWMGRTVGFAQNLALGRFDQLLMSPTPGVTLQWLGTPTSHFSDWSARKLPVALGHALLILVTVYVFSRLWNPGWGFILGLVLAFDPLLLGHSRIFGTDALLALTLMLSLGLLLLWRKEGGDRYVIASGLIATAAVLSKIPGVIILPATASLFGFWWWQAPSQARRWQRGLILWVLSGVIAAGLILPTLALDPAGVVSTILSTFESEGYTELHTGKWHYYGQTLLLFATPLQLLAPLLLILTAWRRAATPTYHHAAFLLAFALIFTLAMSLGAKKGDRYLLPALLALDFVAVAASAALFSTLSNQPRAKKILTAVALFLLAGLAFDAARWYPYASAYVNPLSRPYLNQRRHGWGEGLDQAARYLNKQPEAANLKVATYYPNEFQTVFAGEAVPAHQHEEASIDYVVIYRAMFERGPEAWETDVVNFYANRQPVHVVTLSGVPFAWIYATAAD